MGKIKNREDKNKISQQDVKINCAFRKKYDAIFFSFKYLTNQNKYSLDQFKKSQNIRDDINVLNMLHERLKLMSVEGWAGLEKRNKYQGGRELLDYSQINFNAYDPMNDLNLSNDTKIMSIRFGGNKYRLIGYKSKLCPAVFYILGIDKDFSAYDHGS